MSPTELSLPEYFPSLLYAFSSHFLSMFFPFAVFFCLSKSSSYFKNLHCLCRFLFVFFFYFFIYRVVESRCTQRQHNSVLNSLNTKEHTWKYKIMFYVVSQFVSTGNQPKTVKVLYVVFCVIYLLPEF